MKKVLFALLALCVVVPACGGDDAGSVTSMDESSSSSASASSPASEKADSSSSGEQAFAGALAASLASDPEFPFPDEGLCITESVVDEIGLDRLIELGITEDSGSDDFEVLPAEVQVAFINGIVDCVGKSGLATLLVQLSNEDLDDGPPLSMEDAECIAEGLSDEQWSSFLQGAFSGDELSDESGADFFVGVLEACPQILVNSFKDDLGLDQSQAECLAGSLTGTLIDVFTSGALETGDAPPEIFGELIEAFIGCGIDLAQLE
ncbi:MAG: hypothetical protein CL455_07820 [Acidimicrobiaceae bacterium]|nr:hypothetical protein [Acidimicrobiaceae bacterium]